VSYGFSRSNIDAWVAQMENGCLDAAPVWSDLGTFDGEY